MEKLVAVLNPDGTLVGSGGGPVSGTVSVDNFPATQPVSGTVNVGDVAGTVITSPLNFPTDASGGAAVTAPVANGTVLLIAAAATGQHRVTITMMLSGTGTPVTPHNYDIQAGAGTTYVVACPAVKNIPFVTELNMATTAAQNVVIRAIADEAADVVVSAHMTMTPIT